MIYVQEFLNRIECLKITYYIATSTRYTIMKIWS